jgi:hypothetical protein
LKITHVVKEQETGVNPQEYYVWTTHLKRFLPTALTTL